MRPCITILIAAAALASAAGTPANADVRYAFTLVDAFSSTYGLRETYLYDINDQNVATGTTTITIGGSTGYTGFYWQPPNQKTAVGISWPRGINNNGLLAGVSGVFDIPSNQFTTVPNLPSMYYPLALLDVNDAGIAVGYEQICNCSNSQGTLQVPYVWDAVNGARTLSVPGAKGAARINTHGLVVGWTGSWSMPDSYLYDLNSNTYLYMSSVFAGPNVQTTAVDVNDNNVVVGSRLNSNGTISWGYTWSAKDGVTLLPLPPAGFQPYLKPSSINDAGVIVGSMFTPIATQVAFIYDAAHGVRELRTLTDAPADFTLMTATAINDNGWIVGFGYGGGGGGMYKSFVLRPIPAGDITGDGSVNIDDLLAVIAAWGACPVPPGSCPADVDDSGSVDIDDLLLVISNWG